MVKKRVINYVNGLLQKGYSASDIRNNMLKYGYSQKEIDDAVNSIYNPTIRHEIHLSKATIFVIVLILASLIGTASFFYFYSNSKVPSTLLDLNLEPVTTSVQPGQSVVFVKEISNLGSSKRYDVVIKQEILDVKTFKVITEKTETRAIETFGSTQTRMIIPQDTMPGDYILRAIVEYDNKKAIANLPIKILVLGIAVDKCSDGIINNDETGVDCGGTCKSCEALNCDDSNKCTEDAIVDSACVNRPITPCCSNKICESNEKESCAEDCKKDEILIPSSDTIDEIRELAKTDPSKAMQQCNGMEVEDLKDACMANVAEAQSNKNYCTKIFNSRIKDVCYSNIAKLLNDNSICNDITADSRRDSCYMTFVLDNNDYSVCVKITNEQLRQSCNSLRQLNELSQ